jgi:phage FluMu protein Com
MKLKISENADPNYLASVVEIKQLRSHSNADRLQVATVFGNDCIVGLDTQVGDVMIYFPLECQISPKLLSHCNLFSDPNTNVDGKSKGYFDKKRRVKAVRLRGERSVGFLMKVDTFAEWANVEAKAFDVGTDFNSIDDELICEKYIPTIQRSQGGNNEPREKVENKDSLVKRLLPNQFRFHYSTAHLGRNSHLLNPDDIISISEKLHGQNFVASNVLTRPILSWKDKVAKFLGVKVVDKGYQFVYSSRSVVKSRRDGSIGDDQWGVHAKELENKLPPGYTVIGELVGFGPGGNGLQKGYDYGCEPATSKLKIFRITYTDPIGECLELSVFDIQRFCEKYNLETVPYHYIGRAGDAFSIDEDESFSDEFVKMVDKTYLDLKCPLCKNDVWNEGIVLAIENKVNRPVFKHKSFEFTQKESSARDKGEVENEDV